jgi:hypothetical protein
MMCLKKRRGLTRQTTAGSTALPQKLILYDGSCGMVGKAKQHPKACRNLHDEPEI